MKQYAKKLFSLVVLLGATGITEMAAQQTPAVAQEESVLPFIQFRSQGRDTARKLYGTTIFAVDQWDMDTIYGTFNVTFQYDRSFRNSRIAHCLFGDSLVNVPNVNTDNNACKKSCDDTIALIISGSQVENRDNAKDWMAENFLLPRDFRSVVTFKPQVQDILVDFNFFVGFDRWCSGLYMRLYGPVVNNRTKLRANETVTAEGTVGYDAGFFAPAAVERDQLFTKASQFFNGDQLANPIEGITFTPLQFAKIATCGSHSKTGFAELRGEFGWNYLSENWHFGFNIQAAAPTGTRPNAEFLFPPQVGNGKHWELGGGLSTHWTMWRSEDEEKSWSFFVEADITHLFKAKQLRTFDLKGKPNSRYMLAERMDADVPENLFSSATAGTGQTGTQPNAAFNNAFMPVANFSTRNVNVSIGVQGDLVAMFTYAVRGFTWDLGYNFWGMSHEKICLSSSDCRPAFPKDVWALKGDAQVFGFLADATPVALSATESLATIHNGTNIAAGAAATPPVPANTNPGVDNAQFAQTDATGTAVINNVPTGDQLQIKTSNPAILIKETDLDLTAAQTRGISNKIFTHFSYTWVDRDRWVPYIGGGVSAEFGSGHGKKDNCPDSSSNKCPNKSTTKTTNACDNLCGDSSGTKCAISKWAIELKGGISFH